MNPERKMDEGNAINRFNDLRIGLEQKYIDIICRTATTFSEIEKVVLFGSRAMETARKGSDVDLAIAGSNVTRSTRLLFLDRLNEETTIPWFVDVVDYHSIENRELKTHIDRYGIVIYRSEHHTNSDNQ